MNDAIVVIVLANMALLAIYWCQRDAFKIINTKHLDSAIDKFLLTSLVSWLSVISAVGVAIITFVTILSILNS